MNRIIDAIKQAHEDYLSLSLKGGTGSGNHGHSGRPGHIGGSVGGSGAGGAFAPGDVVSFNDFDDDGNVTGQVHGKLISNSSMIARVRANGKDHNVYPGSLKPGDPSKVKGGSRIAQDPQERGDKLSREHSKLNDANDALERKLSAAIDKREDAKSKFEVGKISHSDLTKVVENWRKLNNEYDSNAKKIAKLASQLDKLDY